MRFSNLMLAVALMTSGCATSGDDKSDATTAQTAAQNHVLVNEAGIAVQGYDVVAYFTDNTATPGDPSISSTHDGATYHFVNTQHKSMFDADAAKYVPKYGGYCAFAVAVSNSKVAIDPETFRVQDGRLLLFFNSEVDGQIVDTAKYWDKDSTELLSKADGNWPSLITK